ncbi:N-acetylglucosamine kinase [Ruminiclostridium papyrosolvens DSM 2782]|uniref:N-acetylglucosamine kinase n=2 Tax=Ruminiclostridium papyrosolvens TaxID=29362 RepID=F1TF44_9FIRM|nr:N-acetylglucosamine kinase [Ruminiclostridium papyrosolvens DSM 2782]
MQMPDKLGIGIDGGGTKTKVLVKKSLTGDVLFEKKYPSTNYNNIGVDGLEQVLKTIYTELTEKFGKEQLANASLAMGAAGIDRPQDEVIYREALKNSGFDCNFEVFNDAYIALMGGNGGRKGALLITGTGSIAIGISTEGKEVRTGGWGYMTSDDGSGYKLGIKAVSAIMDSYDEIIENTSLTERVLNYYGIKSPEDFMDLIYIDKDFSIDKIAAIAPIVQEEAEKGDAAALDILYREIERLVAMIKALAKKMKTNEFRLCLAGSLMLKSDIYLRLFKAGMNKSLPGIQICEPLNEPAYGALIIALGEGTVNE